MSYFKITFRNDVGCFNPILSGGGVFSTPLGFFAHNSGGRKIIQASLVTFLKIYRNLLKGKILSADPLLLPWQHFLGEALRDD